MKKTLIIVAIIAVVAVVAFLLLRKKDKNADGANGMIGGTNPNAGKTEEEILLEQQAAAEAAQIEAAKLQIASANSAGYATQEDLEAIGVILTAEEKREQQDLASRYYEATGMSAKDLSLDVLRRTVPEVEKAKVAYDKLQKEFPSANFDVDYSKIVLGSTNYDEEEEILTVYEKLTSRDAQIKQMAADFMYDLQDGIVWSDGKRPVKKTVGAILTGGLSLLKDNSEKVLWQGFRGWNTENMRNIIALTPKESKQFEKYFKSAYTDFYYRPKDWNKGKLQTKQNAWSRKNAKTYSGDTGLNGSNVTLLKLLTFNGKDKDPHSTRYFADRDSASGRDWSMELYNKFSKLK